MTKIILGDRLKKFFLTAALAVVALSMCLYMGRLVQKVYRHHFGIPVHHALLKADLSDLTDATLSHYYIHSDGRNAHAVASGLYANPPFDANGVPMVDYGGKSGRQYNPVTISQFALETWELFLQIGSEEHLRTFLRQARWLLEHQENGKWYYTFDLERRSIKAPWISAMAQGQGICVLLRAHQNTGRTDYLSAARRAFEVMRLPVDQGGTSYPGNEGIWLEEYPNAPILTHVMNGHVWALFGVWDIYRVTGSDDSLRLFSQGVAALKADLGRYDIGYWAVSDQGTNKLLNSTYMDFEIDQLTVMHALTSDPAFLACAKKWDAYRQNSRNIWPILWHHIVRRGRLLLGQ